MAESKIPAGERRKETRYVIALPVRYYFIHNVEKRDTKQFRNGTTRDVSSFGLFFEAPVIDPSILPAALRGEVLLAVRVTPEEGPMLKATCRVVWASPLKDSPGHYALGVEYTEADEEMRLALYQYAEKHGQPA